MVDGYRGVFGAIPFALRHSDSWVFRIYVLVSTLAAAVVSGMFVISVVVLVANTAAVEGGSLTLSRSFFILVGLLAVAPMLAPTLFVARRHRTDRSVDERYDTALALSGFLFLLALYAGVLASIPAQFEFDGELVSRPPPSGSLAPVIDVLYGIPSVAAPAVPLVAAVLIYLVHRQLS